METNLHDCLSCFCPGILLGNISSKFKREVALCKCSCCSLSSQYQIGSSGMQTCSWTCCMASLGWPLSPCLGYYLMHQRWKLKLFYPYDDRFTTTQTYSQWCYLCTCWPVNLSEQHKYINLLCEEGALTFQWDFDHYKDQLTSRPSFDSHTVFIFASQTPATKYFISKFVMHTKNKDTEEKKEPDKKPGKPPTAGKVIPTTTAPIAADTDNNIVEKAVADGPIEEEEETAFDFDAVDHISTATRSMVTPTTGRIFFLDYWCIPPSLFHSVAITSYLSQAIISFYLFDPLHDSAETIQALKEAYLSNSSLQQPSSPPSSSQPPQLISPSAASGSSSRQGSTMMASGGGGPLRVIVILDYDKKAQQQQQSEKKGGAGGGEEEEQQHLLTVDLHPKPATVRSLVNWAKRNCEICVQFSLLKEGEYKDLEKLIFKALKKEE